jgi:hypothetical protein
MFNIGYTFLVFANNVVIASEVIYHMIPDFETHPIHKDLLLLFTL